MIKNLKPISLYTFTKNALFLLLIVYSLVCTVMLLKLKPTTLVIGIDAYGTRIIETKDDRLVRLERHNFVKKFVQTLYNYDQNTFRDAISIAGDMMDRKLWEERHEEYFKLSEQLKVTPLKQEIIQIEDIRELDPTTYQTDIKLKVSRNLTEKFVHMRLDLKLSPSLRSQSNPFPYEVTSYEEQVF